jgi:hypothetical protein
MGIKKLLFTSFMFGAIILGTTQNASANTGTDSINDDTIKSLPEGVELYYPKNPELLVDENYVLSENSLINPYANEQLPRKVNLTTSDKSASTTRLQMYSGDKLGVNILAKKFGKLGTVVGIVYRNGVYYQGYVVYNTNQFVDTLNTGDLSEYSLRLYCGNPDEQETGCSAEGAVYPVK